MLKKEETRKVNYVKPSEEEINEMTERIEETLDRIEDLYSKGVTINVGVRLVKPGVWSVWDADSEEDRGPRVGGSFEEEFTRITYAYATRQVEKERLNQ